MRLINNAGIIHYVRIILLFLCMGISGTSFAQQTSDTRFNYNHFSFRLLDTPGECELLGIAEGYNPSGDLIIPATAIYNGHTYSVTSIYGYAFSNRNEISGSLTIPESVTSIGVGAFYNCNGLKGSLTIPSRVTKIGSTAFAFCTGFSGLTLPESLIEIGPGAFYQCKFFTGSLNIPENVTTIGNHAFYYCKNFTGSLIIPEGVKNIGSNTFEGCIGFTDIILPEKLDTIGQYAFSGCTGLTGLLTIPDKVTTIKNYAFKNCSGITEISFPNNLRTIEAGVFSGCTGLTGSLTIPDKVTIIGDDAFKDCTSLSGTLTLGSSMAQLGITPFYGCDIKEIHSLNLIPPTSIAKGQEADIFTAANKNATLIVPHEATEAYANSRAWSPFFEPNEITLDKTAVTFAEGESIQLTTTIFPESAIDKSVKWTSADQTIARVDETGKVKAIELGETYITATTTNGLTTSCRINVIIIDADDISLNLKNVNMTQGESTLLTATVSPENTTDKSVTWTSADQTVA
ncbi:MAG: leucine-rich repeat protein, partial [Paramuribaculum sp.]|nr:leucine-rich repeat protein [Paramuribaculum sp.]